MPSIIAGIIKNPALQFIMGINVLIIGLFLTLSHNIWVSSWQVLITIIAWAVLIKGVFYVTLPDLAQRFVKAFLQSQSTLYLAILINFLLGIYLCYYGFIGV
jgi:hypothetical protein